jgi:uncharacterized protein YjbJ (UPF0337 family)
MIVRCRRALPIARFSFQKTKQARWNYRRKKFPFAESERENFRARARKAKAGIQTTCAILSSLEGVLPSSPRFYGRSKNAAGAPCVAPSQPKGGIMNWDQIEGKWKQTKGKVRERWGRLTDDDMDQIAGKREQLVGRLQERYGLMKEVAEEQVNDFLKGYREESEAKSRRAGQS